MSPGSYPPVSLQALQPPSPRSAGRGAQPLVPRLTNSAASGSGSGPTAPVLRAGSPLELQAVVPVMQNSPASVRRALSGHATQQASVSSSAGSGLLQNKEPLPPALRGASVSAAPGPLTSSPGHVVPPPLPSGSVAPEARPCLTEFSRARVPSLFRLLSCSHPPEADVLTWSPLYPQPWGP